MSIASKFKAASRIELLSFIFYIISGALLFVLLPFSNYAPHLALIGIFSIITAVALLVKKNWAIWFVAVLLVVIAAFTLSTIFSIGYSNLLVTAGLAAYFVLALIATVFIASKRK